MRAVETIAATRRGLETAAGELDAAYRAQVDAALAQVEEALATEDPATQVGDAARLKAASAELDAVTARLAELLMDRAMETLLRQRGLIT